MAFRSLLKCHLLKDSFQTPSMSMPPLFNTVALIWLLFS